MFELFRGSPSGSRSPRRRAKRCRCCSALGVALGEILVYGPVRDQLGLRRARWVYTGGAPLGADAFRFFRSFGINLKQVYGSTELSGLASVQRDGEADPDTVGPGRSRHRDPHRRRTARCWSAPAAVFQGYYKQAEATARGARPATAGSAPAMPALSTRAAISSIIDRASDVGKLADGTALCPAIHREQAQIQPVYRRGGGLRRRAAVCRGDDRDRSRHASAIGPSAATSPTPRSRI